MKNNIQTGSLQQSIFDDKVFVRQFSLLLSLIIAISLFLIYHSLHQVSDLSFASMTSSKESSTLSLGMVEEELNGNVISLEVIEDNFNDLAERDLHELEVMEEKSSAKVLPKPSIAPADKPATVQEKHKLIEITSVEIKEKAPSVKSLKWLKKKFYASNNVKYALDIAKRFYSAKKYKEALKWSLIANEVDQKNAQSWILFAKTKIKMGKKQDAINVLSAYLKTYRSSKVSRYLKKIKSS